MFDERSIFITMKKIVKDKRLAFRVNPEMYKLLQKMAIEDDMPVSMVVRIAIREYIERRGFDNK